MVYYIVPNLNAGKKSNQRQGGKPNDIQFVEKDYFY